MRALLGGFVVLAGCNELFSGVSQIPVAPVNEALVEVVPAAIDFGQRTSKDPEVTQTITVTNVGQAVLFVDSVSLLTRTGERLALHTNAAFPVEIQPSGIGELDTSLRGDDRPQEGWTFDVSYQALTGGDTVGSVLIHTTAQDSPDVEVPIKGFGAMAQLQIAPNPVDFGTVAKPCDGRRTITLTNLGPEPLVISSAVLESGSDPAIAMPYVPAGLTINQNQIYNIELTLDASEERQATATLVVESNDPQGTQRAAINGVVNRPLGNKTDTFQVPEDYAVDFVFAIDQSCSMADDQQRVANNFSSLVSTLESGGADWKVGVVTGAGTPNGACFIDTVFTNGTPNLLSRVSSAVQYGDDYGLMTEALLGLVDKAFLNDRQGVCNKSFHRPNAPLHIIVVSDEPDQSPIQDGAATYVNNYRIYAGAAPVMVHAIVDVQYGGPCNNQPEKGPGQYLNASAMTGGIYADICTANWASLLANIGQAALGDRTFFPLSQPRVDPDTIEVRVNGVLMSTGWTFDATRRAVKFDANAPSGSTVAITYGTLLNCQP